MLTSTGPSAHVWEVCILKRGMSIYSGGSSKSLSYWDYSYGCTVERAILRRVQFSDTAQASKNVTSKIFTLLLGR